MLVGMLAALGMLALAPSIATAKTKVITVPAEVVAEDKFNPNNEDQCGAIGFVKWQDPPANPERIPIAWTVYWTHLPSGEERSDTATPPFHDTIDLVGAEYLVGGGSHWWSIAWGSKGGHTVSEVGCSDITERILANSGAPARVEITLDLKEPEVDQKKCKAARAELRARNKAVGKLLGKLRRADSEEAKDRIRENLADARVKRAQAAQRMQRVCT
jgi:hypothetical protein